jgi:hypothetical protein
MNKEGAVLAARILTELKEISKLVYRIEQAWKKAKKREDDFYLDSVALNLHGFYSGLERIFEKIAASVDGSVPEGANWHKELLNQMSMEITGIRPAVISSDLKQKLEEYRGFRHVVRNVYTYHLSPEKIEPLVDTVQEVIANSEKELSAFSKFLQSDD